MKKYQWYQLVMVIMAAILVVGSSGMAWAEKPKKRLIDDMGIDFYYATQLPDFVTSDSHDHRASRIMVRAGRYLWPKIKLDGELHFSMLSSHAKREGSEDAWATEIGINAVGRYYPVTLWRFMPYIGAMGGLSYLVDHDNQPNLGDTGILGSFGPLFGTEFIMTDQFSAKAEWRYTHTSDPFYAGDSGRNMQGLAVGVTYRF